MPKVRIQEFDTTGRVAQAAISNTVLLPFFADAKPETMTANTILIKSVADLNSVLTKTSSASTSGTSPALVDTYTLCEHLIEIGFDVLLHYHELGAEGSSYNLSGLEDRNLYDIRFITGGVSGAAIEGDATNAYRKELIKLAAKRQDCVALISVPEINGSEDFTYGTAAAFRTIAESAIPSGTDAGAAIYGAMFTPWFVGELGGTEYIIPAEYGYLFAYANATRTYPEWYAIAGFDRGVIPELVSVCHEWSTADVEVLQARSATVDVDLDGDGDNVGFAINPICYVRPAGHILYGNRTLKTHAKADDNTGTLTAQSFLNIRNGLSAIKKVMYIAARKYAFEQNTEVLWTNFQSYITPLLDRMQTGNGILGYQFIKKKTDRKARLCARLNLIPVEAVEDFDLEIYLTDDLSVSE